MRTETGGAMKYLPMITRAVAARIAGLVRVVPASVSVGVDGAFGLSEDDLLADLDPGWLRWREELARTSSARTLAA
jgi:hypothetical protein